MASASMHPVVHLELHTGNLPRACGFYTGLFGWRLEQVRMGSGSYLTLDLGSGIEGGVVEHDTKRTKRSPSPSGGPWPKRIRLGLSPASLRAESLLRAGSGVSEA